MNNPWDQGRRVAGGLQRRACRRSAFPGLVLCLWLGIAVFPAQAGLTEEGPYLVFRSGPGSPVLLTGTNTLQIPAAEYRPELLFDFGFSTEEPGAAGVFHDSFTLTLQGASGGLTSVLLTADQSGVSWAPSTPGGLEPTNLTWVARTFAPLQPLFTNWVAYTVSWLLPPDFAELGVSLLADFFDNQDSLRSLAYLTNVRVESELPGREPTVLALDSSASLEGPYAEETVALFDLTNRTVTLKGGVERRFFRVRSAPAAQLARLVVTAESVRMRYAIYPEGLEVEGAGVVEGPYLPVTDWKLDADRQAIRVEAVPGNRFLRLRSAEPVELRSVVEGGDVLLFYELRPRQLELWSSARVEGPYARESGPSVDEATRWLSIPRRGVSRFYRLRGDVRVQMTGIERRGEDLVIRYRVPTKSGG